MYDLTDSVDVIFEVCFPEEVTFLFAFVAEASFFRIACKSSCACLVEPEGSDLWRECPNALESTLETLGILSASILCLLSGFRDVSMEGSSSVCVGGKVVTSLEVLSEGFAIDLGVSGKLVETASSDWPLPSTFCLGVVARGGKSAGKSPGGATAVDKVAVSALGAAAGGCC